MTDKEAAQAGKPVLETDTYRILDGRSLTRKERRRLRGLTMAVRPIPWRSP
jgi:hypothetical protein